MGYSELNSWIESDMAADFVADITEYISKRCNKELKLKENCYNTDGIINVGLFLESYNLIGNEDDYKFNDMIVKVHKLLEKKIKEENNSKEWDSEKNKDFHITAYKRIKSNIKKKFRFAFK